ncbi:MAG: helix-turn-helix domain-containing protein [Nitrososphaerota archaeon]|nr:helix-turn-helix domain-containing protein [Nitrososphaerota archaeon]
MSSPRRVRTIYSVIASPNRLDILRILNTKGPLSYSELKTLAGFKSKKESGKFAYHLRKLVKQTLISLNRAERKYTVTSLGRLVLNLTKQIEEQSMLESGKLYVRSSRQAMEEFNADKILQSLVREAGMPVELAQKIASETEARVYKFQTAYLTAPLIREIVNSLLVEHGYEEYRHKLTRLGLPVADVTELIARAGDSTDSIDSVLATTSSRVFAEYSILTKIPRDVSDAHLSGDIHISGLGTWTLMPDTFYFDLNALYSNPYNLGSKLSYVPRLGPIKNFDSALETMEILASIASREVSNEVCLDNLIPYLCKLYATRSQEEQVKMFSRIFWSLSATSGQGRARSISFRVGEPQKDEDISAQLELRDSLLEAYSKYAASVPIPTVHLVMAPGRYFDRRVVEGISRVIGEGGEIALESEGRFTFSGLKIGGFSPNGAASDGMAVLHNLTLNLPRLAYESNKDETYFRAKLAILLQTAINALTSRRDNVKDSLKKGLLPALSQIPTVASIEDLPISVNMVGLNEAVSNLISDRETLTRREIALKILDTASKVASEKAAKLGQRAFVSMIHEDGFQRLAEIDTEKYGRTPESRRAGYREGLLVQSEHSENEQLISETRELAKSASGGCLVTFEFPRESPEGLNYGNYVNGISGKLQFVRFTRNPEICKKCGLKVFSGGRCANCKSTSLIAQPILV